VAVFDDSTKDSIRDGGRSDRLFADAADKIAGLTEWDGLTAFS